jgi:hypothetical protein
MGGEALCQLLRRYFRYSISTDKKKWVPGQITRKEKVGTSNRHTIATKFFYRVIVKTQGFWIVFYEIYYLWLEVSPRYLSRPSSTFKSLSAFAEEEGGAARSHTPNTGSLPSDRSVFSFALPRRRLVSVIVI